MLREDDRVAFPVHHIFHLESTRPDRPDGSWTIHSRIDRDLTVQNCFGEIPRLHQVMTKASEVLLLLLRIPGNLPGAGRKASEVSHELEVVADRVLPRAEVFFVRLYYLGGAVHPMVPLVVGWWVLREKRCLALVCGLYNYFKRYASRGKTIWGAYRDLNPD